MSQQLFSSESVTEGHPDKVCDRISDAILDALLAADPHSRVAVETMAATGLIHIAGEVTTEAYVEIPEIVRREILSIGYDSSRVGFDGASCGVSVSLDGQSPDIAGGVDEALEVRGTQGGMFLLDIPVQSRATRLMASRLPTPRFHQTLLLLPHQIHHQTPHLQLLHQRLQRSPRRSSQSFQRLATSPRLLLLQ